MEYAKEIKFRTSQEIFFFFDEVTNVCLYVDLVVHCILVMCVYALSLFSVTCRGKLVKYIPNRNCDQSNLNLRPLCQKSVPKPLYLLPTTFLDGGLWVGLFRSRLMETKFFSEATEEVLHSLGLS